VTASVGPVRPPQTVGELVGFGRPGGLTSACAIIMRPPRRRCTTFPAKRRKMILLRRA